MSKTLGDLSQFIEEKRSIWEDYHLMVIPLQPDEHPDPTALARMAVEVWHNVPDIARRLADAEVSTENFDGQRVLIVMFKRLSTDPVFKKGDIAQCLL